MDPNLLSSYEGGRSQLNYRSAYQILSRFPLLNPEWLAGVRPDLMEAESYITYPAPEELDYGPRTLFSLVFTEVLHPRLLDSRAAWLTEAQPSFPLFRLSMDTAGRLRAEELVRLWLRRWLAYLPDEKLNDYLDGLKRQAETLLKRFLESSGDSALDFHERVQQRIAEVKRLHFALEAALVRGEGQKKSLTETSGSFIGDDVKVKPQWPELKRRLQKATAAIGAKTTLAKVLDVDPTQISQWLSESKSAREPGAEYTLQMLRWVELQERKPT
ncbi:MAG: hypothetical protein IH623_27840 [Verrucomicrobia bacterium]|nr:hypothetical protein [Verrucomicrobiota bacterium]